MNYTASATVAVAAAIVYDLIVARTNLLSRKAFWTAYAIILGFQLIVNGILTGLHIVRYDRHRIIGLRFIYAPVEDLLFGFAMVLATLTTWVLLGRRAVQTTPREAQSTPREPGG
ncbi:MAG: lycopene cyclase domain-containing protein [Actinomycetota bacterium]|nr:lycopene cyclase domain-containing protein [Actinomycetota bacterium]